MGDAYGLPTRPVVSMALQASRKSRVTSAMKPLTCPVCKSARIAAYLKSVRDYMTGTTFEVQQCEQCGVGFTVPPPADMDAFYPARYRRYTTLVTAALRTLYRWRVRSWARMREKPGTALEVGCGNGFMLDVLRQQGWQVLGTERTEESASYARSVLGLQVITGGLEALPKGLRFDLIILFQVLEHIADPLALLEQCARLL